MEPFETLVAFMKKKYNVILTSGPATACKFQRAIMNHRQYRCQEKNSN